MHPTSPETAEVLQHLREASGAFEAFETRRFVLYRTTGSGKVQKVCVTVTDSGEDSLTRFSVRAETDDGKSAAGNPHDQLSAAIKLVHWQNLG